MASDYRKFVFSPDKHLGFVNTDTRQKAPIHDLAAITAMLKFTSDFKPDVFIEGGDSLDLSAISHWNAQKPLDIEQLDIVSDIELYNDEVLRPLDQMLPRNAEKIWMKGNHEAWLDDVRQKFPGLRNATELNLQKALALPRRGWEWKEQGETVQLGEHLALAHGDNISGGEHVAKQAVVNYESNIRFGHHHTHQIYTKHSPISSKLVKTGAAVGCLCTRNPHFNKRKTNKWVQGFNYGYIFKDGTFTDFFPVIINGKFAAEGKVYRG